MTNLNKKLLLSQRISK